MLRSSFIHLSFAFVAALTLCAALSPAYAGEALYRRLGGRETIQQISGEFVEMLSRDPKLRLNSTASKFLDNVKPAELKQQLVDLACEATQGPCKAKIARIYLKRVIEDVELTDFDWGAVSGDFQAALTKFNVAADLQGELTGLFAQAKACATPNESAAK
jgi:hypothetical protein